METFIDGFEEFYGAGSPGALLTRAEYATAGTWSVVAGRSSLANSSALAGSRANLGRTFDFVGDKFSCGVAHLFDARGSILFLKSGAAEVTLWMHEETGLPMMNDNSGGALPTKNRWYYYELEIDRAADTVSLFINNRLDSTMAMPAGFDAASEITVGIGYRPVGEYRPGASYPDQGNKYIDDFYARSAERIGPIIVSTRFPSLDVNVEWFKASTTMTHAESLSQHPPDPLDSYVAADTIGKEDRFASSDLLANANPILATSITVMARKAPTLNAKLGVFMGGNAGADARSANITVATDWVTHYIAFEKDDGDTKAGIEASQFGINVAAP